MLDGDGDPAPPQKGAQLPQFSAHIYCGQTAGCIRYDLVGAYGVGLDAGDIVLDGIMGRWDPLELGAQHVHSPQFSANVYCGQTAAWIKMPLGTDF